jgi:hypothetical protein
MCCWQAGWLVTTFLHLAALYASTLQHTVIHCVIGLKILNELVTEMNQRTKKRSMTQHRKVAVSFRDHSLMQTFEIGIALLNQVSKRQGLEGLCAKGFPVLVMCRGLHTSTGVSLSAR